MMVNHRQKIIIISSNTLQLQTKHLQTDLDDLHQEYWFVNTETVLGFGFWVSYSSEEGIEIMIFKIETEF